MKTSSMKHKSRSERSLNRDDDESQNRRRRLYLLNNSMTAIKEYVEM
jgi:hypothetical protein